MPPPAAIELHRVRDVEGKSKAVENNLTASADDARFAVRQLRDEVLLLRGSAELPARNVSNLGFLLYSEYLLTVELAGTLLSRRHDRGCGALPVGGSGVPA